MAHQDVYLPRRDGHKLLYLFLSMISLALLCLYFRDKSGEQPISVAGVVVVRSARSIDIAEVSGVADIRGTKPPIRSRKFISL